MHPITLAIIAITCITSFFGFSNRNFFERGKFNTDAILRGKQFDRLLTSAFLHGDGMHLLFNMLTLYFFSNVIIATLGTGAYLIIYFAAILIGNLLSLWMYRRNPYYSAIGASGGVSGILFAAIAIFPQLGLYIFFIPIAIPGWIFGILYLAYSVYGMKQQLGNIGHAAHLGGALAGIIIVIILAPQVLQINGLYIGLMAIPLAALGYYVYKER
ncbi:rhomboid family intramembrane serine protease [Dysgonomonas sp. 216]|nr:rhomboid family intramembrane serine protease [Dysgonomonas sp. 216]